MYGLKWSSNDKELAFGGNDNQNTSNGHQLNNVAIGSQVCNLTWSRNLNELVSTHFWSQNQMMDVVKDNEYLEEDEEIQEGGGVRALGCRQFRAMGEGGGATALDSRGRRRGGGLTGLASKLQQFRDGGGGAARSPLAREEEDDDEGRLFRDVPRFGEGGRAVAQSGDAVAPVRSGEAIANLGEEMIEEQSLTHACASRGK
ncbi:hypothetical protein Fmac_031884 [Flemingia macrophylla]|uniref:Uncharacterized protein n=1 Tax=Flemingia macrophylla TaxID=520843 RepID=A0ABD1L3S1_9FABA